MQLRDNEETSDPIQSDPDQRLRAGLLRNALWPVSSARPAVMSESEGLAVRH